MKTALTAFALALSLAAPAHADVIQGGTRQQYDAAHCSVYRPVWSEYDRSFSDGVVRFGPEAQVPSFLTGANLPPARQAAALLWGQYTQMNSRYAGAGGDTSRVIGYDQLYIAFAVANTSAEGQVGPRLPMPRLTDYLPLTAEKRRLWTVANLVWALSFGENLTAVQLSLIDEVLRETPTCGGVVY